MAWTVAVLCEYCLNKLATIFSLFFIRSNANPINFYSWPVSYSYYGESPLMIDGHVPVQPIIIIARWLYSSWTTLLPMVVDGIRTRSWARIKYWFGTCLFDRWWLGNVTAQNRSTTSSESVGRDLYLTKTMAPGWFYWNANDHEAPPATSMQFHLVWLLNDLEMVEEDYMHE